MITAALSLISGVSLTALAFSSGWVGFVLAVLGFGPLIALVVLHRNPREPRPVSPFFEDAQALSTLDRLDGVGNPDRKVSE